MNWQDEKVSYYWHEIMDDVSWYSPDEEAYILSRLIARLTIEMAEITTKDEEG